MIDVRPVFYAVGALLCILSVFMFVPMLADLAHGHADASSFLISACVTAFFGVALILAFHVDDLKVDRRQGFLLTTLAWLVLSGFGALPFRFSAMEMNYPAAYFETMSGLTTTGSSAIADLSVAPPGILLWRGLLNALGGAGIIVLALVMLPFLSVGGMQLFRTESSDRSEKLFPRIDQIAGATIGVYSGLIFLCAFIYAALGMEPFDAVVHAMATIATGGFGNHADSFGSYPPSILWAGTFFMACGGMPLALFALILHRGPRALLSDTQVWAFLMFLASATLVMAAWLVLVGKAPLFWSLTHAAFNVVSIVTTTGFASDDYMQWGSFAVMMFLFLTAVGGCTGSTTGGPKIFRYQVLAMLLRRHRNETVMPHAVNVRRYGGRPVGDDVVRAVLVLFALFGATVICLALGLAATGLDIETSFSGALTAVSNVGPGIGERIGPVGSFAQLSDQALWMLSFGMLVGRLEFTTVFILFSRRFWRT